MGLTAYTNEEVIRTITSVSFGMFFTAVIVWLLNRKKTKAETILAQAQTKLTEIETYSKLLADLQTQVDKQALKMANQEEKVRLQEQLILNQAKQIITLQQKEAHHLKTIKTQNINERALTQRVKELEAQIEILKSQINEQS